jgi:hypothetical protein
MIGLANFWFVGLHNERVRNRFQIRRVVPAKPREVLLPAARRVGKFCCIRPSSLNP